MCLQDMDKETDRQKSVFEISLQDIDKQTYIIHRHRCHTYLRGTQDRVIIY